MLSQLYMLPWMQLQSLDNFALQLLAALKLLHTYTHKSCWIQKLNSVNMTTIVQEQ